MGRRATLFERMATRGRLAATPCACTECRVLDRAHPNEGRQLLLVGNTGGERMPAADHPDAVPPARRTARALKGRTSRDARSRPPKAESETPMNALTKIAKTPPAATPPVPSSSIEMIPFSALRRAPENVRKTSIEEDVDALAANIAAVGLLQSLIGYRVGKKREVWIVGGGRRLAALGRLLDDFRIDLGFQVPVLIRDRDEAIELSLAENLERRDMNPADEFEAFRLLMEPGTRSPADIAKRFGLTELYVKQRLRLAELAPEVLDGLRAGDMTLAGALAYAKAPDPEVQRQVYAAQKRRAYDKHDPNSIRTAVTNTGKTTGWALYKFIGAAAYEREGGNYDDGLFGDASDYAGERRLAHQFLIEKLARDHIDFQMLREARAMAKAFDVDEDLVVGHVIYPDIELPAWWRLTKPKPPAGFIWVDHPHSVEEVRKMWAIARRERINAQLLVGIDNEGNLAAWRHGFFVEKEQATRVRTSPAPAGYTPPPPPTPEEREAADRAAGVDLWSKRLAVGDFAGSFLDGRVFWPTGWGARNPERKTIDGVEGWWVPMMVFVSDAEVAAQIDVAGQRYDQAKREAAEAAEAKRIADEEAAAQVARRHDELLGMDPPAVAVIDGEAWFRTDEGGYGTADEEGWCNSWVELLGEFADEGVTTFDTREAFDAAHAAAAARQDAIGATEAPVAPDQQESIR